jgi:hypothetical protein
VIAHYQRSVGDPDIANAPDCGVALLIVPQPFVNHNGGQFHFVRLATIVPSTNPFTCWQV